MRASGHVLLLIALCVAQAGCLGEDLSMALGRDGLPLISYQDSDQGWLKVAHCEDAACGTATVSVLDADRAGAYTSIAVGSDGLGLISYEGGALQLRVAHCEDRACTRARVTTLNARSGASHTSIAIGRDGLGLISFRDRFSGDLFVAHCEDVGCTRATVSLLDPDAPSVGEYSAIVIGSDGLGLIAYYDRNRGWLKMAHCEDVACTRAAISVVDDGAPQQPHVGGYVGARAGVAIGPDGVGLVAYQDQPVGDLKVARCADVACSRAESITVADAGSMKGSGTGPASLAFAPNGLPWIAYHGSPRVSLLEQDLRVVRCFDTRCREASATTLDSRRSADVGLHPSLVFGLDGLALVGYQDRGGGGVSGAAVRVARCLDAACSRASIAIVDQER